MAFNIENKASLKLNRIAVGATVALIDYPTKKAFAEMAIFKGWQDGNGNAISAPAVMKAMDQKTTMVFGVLTKNDDGHYDESPLVLVKDPAGFGCMFRKVTKGEGENATESLRRVTAYASPEVIAASKPAPVVQEAATDAPDITEGETLAAPVTEEKPKRGRKGSKKAKAENVTPEAEISEVTEGETASA